MTLQSLKSLVARCSSASVKTRPADSPSELTCMVNPHSHLPLASNLQMLSVPWGLWQVLWSLSSLSLLVARYGTEGLHASLFYFDVRLDSLRSQGLLHPPG